MGRTGKGLSRRCVWRKHILIFVITGSRSYQFNRLIKKLDDLVETGKLNEKIIAQIGDSEPPKHYQFFRYLDAEKFSKYQKEADLIISHAGTGSLIGSIKKGKNVIAVPRLAEYGEHIDDHQLQISGVLSSMEYLREVKSMDELYNVIEEALKKPINKKYERPSYILSILESFIDEIK